MTNYKQLSSFEIDCDYDGGFIIQFKCPNCGEHVELEEIRELETNPHIGGCDNCGVTVYVTVTLVVEWEKL